MACYKEWIVREKAYRDVISVLFLRPVSPACIVLSVTLSNQIRKEHITSYSNWAVRVYTFSQNSFDSWPSVMSPVCPSPLETGKLVCRRELFPWISYRKRLFGSRKCKWKDNIKMYLAEVGSWRSGLKSHGLRQWFPNCAPRRPGALRNIWPVPLITLYLSNDMMFIICTYLILFYINCL
jgi:hypothetical protein